MEEGIVLEYMCHLMYTLSPILGGLAYLFSRWELKFNMWM